MPVKCIGNCNYNMTKQLVKKLKFLWAVDKYLEDAKKENHKDCVKILEEIKKDEERHANILRNHIAKVAANGKFA